MIRRHGLKWPDDFITTRKMRLILLRSSCATDPGAMALKHIDWRNRLAARRSDAAARRRSLLLAGEIELFMPLTLQY